MTCKHNSASRLVFKSTDYISNKPYDVMACDICGVAYTVIDNSPVNNADYYPADYYRDESRYPIFIEWVASYLARKRAAFLPLTGVRGRMVDIGCGQGWFVKQFADQGWEAQGVEVSETAAYHAKKHLGLDILVGEAATQSLQKEQFDIVGLWHVLEHVEEPQSLLNEVSRLLKHDGKALIGVPNFGSPEAKIGKDGWFHLDVPRHLFHFDINSLSLLLRAANLKVVNKSYFVPEYDFFSFIQTTQNRLGLDMNMLYKTLRKGNLGTVKSKPSLLQWLSLVITTPLLAVVSLLVVPIAVLTKNGSSLILIVEKDVKR